MIQFNDLSTKLILFSLNLRNLWDRDFTFIFKS